MSLAGNLTLRFSCAGSDLARVITRRWRPNPGKSSPSTEPVRAASTSKVNPNNNAAIVEPTARYLWLVWFGALVAVRRESKAAVKRTSSEVENTVADARHALRRAEANLSASAHGVRT